MFREKTGNPNRGSSLWKTDRVVGLYRTRMSFTWLNEGGTFWGGALAVAKEGRRGRRASRQVVAGVSKSSAGSWQETDSSKMNHGRRTKPGRREQASFK